MIPKDFRIRREDFPKGRSRIFATTETLSLQVFPGGENPRVTIVVSGKVSKKATQRNTIKRLIREQVQPTLPHLPSGRYVFYAKKIASDAPKKTLRKDTDTLLSLVCSKMRS